MHDMSTTPSEQPNPQPADDVVREELHVRRLELRGLRRSDGLYEVVGRLTDQKPQDFTPASGGSTVPAGQHIHDMSVRLVFDDDMIVRDVVTETVAAPYRVCPEGGRALQALKGLRIGSGWSREVRARIGHAQSCTHLIELLAPMATTAIQSLSVERMSRPIPLGPDGRPKVIDSCYAYSAAGELVQVRWPEFHRPATP
jgi:hypothetical protein